MLPRLYMPGPALSDFIQNFWLYDGRSRLHVRERIFPSGTFELVLNLRDDELTDLQRDQFWRVQPLFRISRRGTIQRILCYLTEQKNSQ